MIAENLKNIRENLSKECFRIGRAPQSVELIAVSKTFGVDHIIEACDAGVSDFGENYVQELQEKRKALSERPIRWHFIGHLQTNKVKYIIDWIHLIHSVDSRGLAEEIQKRAEKIGKVVDILVEVNTSEEATKYGVKPAEAGELIREIYSLPHINLKGLMTIGPFTDDTEESRKAFRILRTIFENENEKQYLRHPMSVLSMGMTHDYAVAIQEGSTMVRIGTAIFGSRTVR